MRGQTFPDYFEALFALAEAPPGAIPVLCVDGPTASGKGTLASELAARLGYHYLDSGALYRITALAALRAGLALDAAHEGAVAVLARALPVRFVGDKVWLGDDDVSDAIRTEEAGMKRLQGLGVAGGTHRAGRLATQFPPTARPGGRRARHGHSDFPGRATQGLPHRQRQPARRAAP